MRMDKLNQIILNELSVYHAVQHCFTAKHRILLLR